MAWKFNVRVVQLNEIIKPNLKRVSRRYSVKGKRESITSSSGSGSSTGVNHYLMPNPLEREKEGGEYKGRPITPGREATSTSLQEEAA
jgi:hypothetical protein